MILQLEVKDTQSEFLLNLLSQLKASVENITIIQPKSTENNVSINMTDEEKWEKYGCWEPNAKTMDMCCSGMLNDLDKKYGSENYEAWQK